MTKELAGLVPGLDGLFDPSAVLEVVATGATWSEGLLWIPARGCLRWNDFPNDRIRDCGRYLPCQYPSDPRRDDDADHETDAINAGSGAGRGGHSRAPSCRPGAAASLAGTPFAASAWRVSRVRMVPSGCMRNCRRSSRASAASSSPNFDSAPHVGSTGKAKGIAVLILVDWNRCLSRLRPSSDTSSSVASLPLLKTSATGSTGPDNVGPFLHADARGGRLSPSREATHMRSARAYRATYPWERSDAVLQSAMASSPET